MSPSATCLREIRPMVEFTLYLVSGDLSISDNRSTPLNWETWRISRGSRQWCRRFRLAVQRNEHHSARLISPPVVGRRLCLTLNLVHKKTSQFSKNLCSAYCNFEVVQKLHKWHYVNYSKTSLTRTRLTQTLALHGWIFGPVKSPWFYREMPTDNTDSVSMDFLITQTPFLGHRVPKYWLTRTKWLGLAVPRSPC